jgi:hypothetical protein
MSGSSTHDQRRRLAGLMGVVVIALGLVGAWRWWLAPRRAAARSTSAPELAAARARASERLAKAGLTLELEPSPGDAAELRWRSPSHCVEVYRLRVDERFRDASVAPFVGGQEEHSRWLLALAGRGDASSAVGVLVSRSDPEEATRERQLWWSPVQVGPAAPDFACRRRSWDPIEDALALAWPKLPARRVRVGESWRGATVEGRCHETTCLDEQGNFTHEQPCRARPWRERLAGVDDGLALILGDWDDGHDPARPEIGILTSRLSLVDEGRPLWVNVQVDHRWSGVHRELELTRIDDCGTRSLAGPGDAALVEDLRASLDARR